MPQTYTIKLYIVVLWFVSSCSLKWLPMFCSFAKLVISCKTSYLHLQGGRWGQYVLQNFDNHVQGYTNTIQKTVHIFVAMKISDLIYMMKLHYSKTSLIWTIVL